MESLSDGAIDDDGRLFYVLHAILEPKNLSTKNRKHTYAELMLAKFILETIDNSAPYGEKFPKLSEYVGRAYKASERALNKERNIRIAENERRAAYNFENAKRHLGNTLATVHSVRHEISSKTLQKIPEAS